MIKGGHIMNCTICGAQIPMGQPNCPNCGAMVQQQAQPMGQPVQPMGGYQQPMGGYQQPMGQPQQMGGGVNANAIIGALTGDIMKLIGLIGAFIIFITPFFTWLKVEFWGEKGSENLFGIADAEDYGIFILYGILLLVVGAALIIWDLADYIPVLGAVKGILSKVPFLELILCAVALLVVILSLAHGDLNETLDLVKDWGGEASRGIGPVIGFIGIIAATAPRVLNMLGIKIGK